MTAPILAVHSETPQPRVVERALTVLSSGGLVAWPTDTAYAIACSAGESNAVAALQKLKGGAHKPLALICPDLSDVSHFGNVSNFQYRVLKRNTPGPFVFILRASRHVPSALVNKQKEIGIRVPDWALATALCQGLGRPLVSTTATDEEGTILRDASDIQDALGKKLGLILDGGVLPDAQTTVVSLIDDAVEVTREGLGELR